jgi:hypothetical protein
VSGFEVGLVKLGILLCSPAFVFLDSSPQYELLFQLIIIFVFLIYLIMRTYNIIE